MYYIYIIQSINFPNQEYTGITTNLDKRLSDHNSGNSVHTSKYAPWKILCTVAMPDKQKAYEFEKYLKSHSGRAFAKKRLI